MYILAIIIYYYTTLEAVLARVIRKLYSLGRNEII